MAKRYFIRVQHKDLVQEQNKLLLALLSKQQEESKTVFVQRPIEVYGNLNQTEWPKPEEEDFEFEFDDTPFIPATTVGNNLLQSVEANTIDFDIENVEKLKKTRSNSKS